MILDSDKGATFEQLRAALAEGGQTVISRGEFSGHSLRVGPGTVWHASHSHILLEQAPLVIDGVGSYLMLGSIQFADDLGDRAGISIENLEPVAEGICGRVSGSPDDSECMHGECDECQIARGEDPVNWAVDPPAWKGWESTDPFETRSSETYAEIETRILADLALPACGCGPYYDCVEHDTDPRRRAAAADARALAERCECGSGVHVRGPGHADYCRLLER